TRRFRHSRSSQRDLSQARATADAETVFAYRCCGHPARDQRVIFLRALAVETGARASPAGNSAERSVTGDAARPIRVLGASPATAGKTRQKRGKRRRHTQQPERPDKNAENGADTGNFTEITKSSYRTAPTSEDPVGPQNAALGLGVSLPPGIVFSVEDPSNSQAARAEAAPSPAPSAAEGAFLGQGAKPH